MDKKRIKNSMTEVQTKIHGKVSTEADFSWREGELNIMDIFKVALDKLNTGDKTSFNIVNENSNYESKKFHKL